MLRRSIAVSCSSRLCFVLVSLLITPVLARAADITWTNGAGGNWNTAANWNSGAGPVPGASDNAVITQAGTYTVTVDTSPTVASITLGGASGTQTLSASLRTITISNASTVGANGVLLLTNTTVAGAGTLTNQGTIVARSGSDINAPYATTAASLLRIEGINGAATLTFSNGFTSLGTIEMTSTGAGYGATLNVTAGSLVNFTGANINVLVGAGGPRTIGAQIDNRGTLTVNQPLTLSKGSADHVNSGTIALSNESLTMTQSGTTPTFTNTGTITVGAGRTFSLSGGVFHYISGSLGGSGSLDFSSTTWNLGQSFTHSMESVLLTNSTVNGPGTLTIASGESLVMSNCTINAALVNQGTLVARSGSDITASFTDTGSSLLRVEGINGQATLTLANAFTNHGTIEMTSTGAGYGAALNVTAGSLVNEVGANLNVLVGAGGPRTIAAQLDNRGTVTLNHPLTLNKSSADHLNSGTIDLSNQSFTLTQSGTTPSFTTTGTVTVGLGQTFAVTGGVLSYSAGTLGGSGSLDFSTLTWNLGLDFTNALTGISLTTVIVNGPGTLTNAVGKTLTLWNCTINTPLINQATVVARSSTDINSTFTDTPSSLLRLEAINGNSTLTFANTFTNHATVEMTSTGAGYGATLNVTTGTLVNEAGANINVIPGAGGPRTIAAQLDNRGTVTLTQPLTLNKASADHLNSGTIDLTNESFTLTQGGTTPTFTTTGTITVGLTHTFTVTAGVLNYNAGSIGGPGSLDFSSLTWNLGPNFTNAGTGILLTTVTVNGPGTLTNAVGKTLTLWNCTINTALINQATLISRSSTDINSTFTDSPSSLLRIEAINGNSTLTFANPFTNHATVEMTSTGAGYGATLNVATGNLVNEAGANINVLPGAGGPRTIGAQLDNRGTITLNQPLTLNKASADHLNSGTIDLSNESFTLTQGGTTPTFTTTGTITVGTGRTFTVTGGVLNYNAGSIGGAGNLDFSSMTWNLGPDFTNALTGISLTTVTVNGPGILTNSTGKLLVLWNCTINANLVNQGTLVARSSTDINGTFTDTPSSFLQVEAINGNATLTFANTFTNHATLDMTSTGAGYGATLNVTTGSLVNEAGAHINVLVGASGPRTIGAQLDNRGIVLVSQPLTLNKASADHLNSGTIHLNNQDFTLSQGGTTPSFTTTGTITVGAGHTFFVTGGVLNYNAGLMGGGGSLDFNSMTWNLGQTFTNEMTAVSLTTVTVNGVPALINASGKLLVLQNCTINAPLTNQGTLIARSSSDINGTFADSPSSLLRVEGINGTATLTFANTFTNHATVEMTSTGAGYGATLNVTTGSLVNEVGANINTLVGAGGPRAIGAQLDNRGTITLNQPLSMSKDAADHLNSGTFDLSLAALFLTQNGTTPSFTNTGTIPIGPGSTLQVSGGVFTNGPAGTLQGVGTLDVAAATFSNAGNINPGTSPGILSITGAAPLAGTSVLNFEIGGKTAGTQLDRLAVSGTATLGGTIHASLINGYTPALGDTFVVMTTGSTAGQFATRDLPTLGGGLEFRVGYLPTSVVLAVVSPTAVTLAINSVSVAEGNAGTTTANFAVTLSDLSSQTITVQYATASDVATSPADFVSGSGTLTFAPGTTSQPVAVTVNGDVLDEADETFHVNLSVPTNATIALAQGIGTITDDDPTPALSINDVSVTEGNAGTVNATFTVSLSAASGRTVTVNAATAPGTATAPADYAVNAGTLTFTPGVTSQQFTAVVNGDALDEADETYFVNLTAPTNATIQDNQGVGTITDDDTPPSISIADVTVTEGHAGTVNAVFNVTLSAASGRTVTTGFATAAGTATSPADFTAASGTVTFAPGETSKSVTVLVQGDTAIEPDETFFVNLSGPTNATLADGQGQGTIGNDDTLASTITIDDVTVSEGNAGTVSAVFTVTLSPSSGQAVNVSYATAIGTAVAPADFTAGSGTLDFLAGETTKTITVLVTGDLLDENDETFVVNLTAPSGATIVDSQGQGTITDDDATPTISIQDVSVAEGNTGTVNAVFTVTLSAASGRVVTVGYATADSSATTPADYTAGSGIVSVTAGNTSQSITVAVKGDVFDEQDEMFVVNLTTPTHATIADGQGLGTITDDDAPPSMAIGDVTVTEGDAGTVQANFVVTLTPASGKLVVVDFTTADNTATSPDDFTPISGTLTFPAGTVSRTVAVQVNGDTTDEPAETFFVNLSTVGNATITDGQGQGLINNDDAVAQIAPRNREYWRHHPDLIALYLPISLGTVNVTQVSDAQLVLKFGEGPDWNHKLRAELMAAMLNFAAGAANAACVQPTIDEAQTFLLAHGTKRLTMNKYKDLAETAQDLMLALRGYNQGNEPCFPGSATLAEERAPGAAVTLGPSYPNPFRASATIEYGLFTSTHARIAIYDVHGREVKVLVNEARPAGDHWAVWDGTDRSGATAASGIYYCRITAGATTQLIRMVLTK